MYVKLTNGSVDQYPYTIGHLRRDNPNVSFPRIVSDDVLARYNVYPVVDGTVPAYNARTQKVETPELPTLVDGTWTIVYSTEELTDSEVSTHTDSAASSVRKQRVALLDETDWVVVKALENGESVASDMKQYRSDLRDITGQASFPYDLTWPTKP
tara:strand:- start:2707 stop:3171 length:465 start_codon:yes stop_codon:yes gene_type:complete